MKEHGIKSVMLTKIFMRRWRLVTTETKESYCKGNEYDTDSVNDDLESLFEDIRLGKEPYEYVRTYFLPKLTEEELELVGRRNSSYLKTLVEPRRSSDPFMVREKMLSELNSTYVHVWSRRQTLVIENSSEKSCSLQ